MNANRSQATRAEGPGGIASSRSVVTDAERLLSSRTKIHVEVVPCRRGAAPVGRSRPPRCPIASPSSSALNWAGPGFDLRQPIFAEAYAWAPRPGGSLALPTTDSTTSAALLALKGRSGASPDQLTPSHRRPGRYRRTNPPECSARESPGHLQAAIQRLRKAARLSVCKAVVSLACPANCSR